MSRHRKKTRARHGAARQVAAAGLGGAAMIGVGVLLAIPPGTPAPEG